LKKNFIYIAAILLSFSANAETPIVESDVKAKIEVQKNIVAEVKDETKKALTKEEVFQINETDIVVGDKNAPVTIIEYASMSCSHCATFFKTTFAPLKEKYIDNGKVKFVFRDFPLDEFALRAAMVAKCSIDEGVDNFLKFKKVLFSTQRNWAGKKNYLEILSNIAKLGGMKQAKFDQCIEDKDLENNILEKRLNASTILEVQSTPTFFVNGEIYAGAKEFEYVSKLIDTILGEDDVELEVTQ
jgi:protein-disulfide isomerase